MTGTVQCSTLGSHTVAVTAHAAREGTPWSGRHGAGACHAANAAPAAFLLTYQDRYALPFCTPGLRRQLRGS